MSASGQSNEGGKHGLRILAVTDTIGLGGGAEQLLASLLPAVSNLGRDVELAAIKHWEPDLGAQLERSHIRVCRLHLPEAAGIVPAAFKLRKLLRSGNYGILWSHQRYSAMACALAAIGMRRIVHVTTIHSEGYARSEHLPLRARLSVWAEGLLLGSLVKVAVSKAVAGDYAAFFGWRDIRVIYNGVDTAAIPPPLSAPDIISIRSRYGCDEADCLLVVLARYVEKKGHATLIEALKMLRRERNWLPKVHAFGVGPLKEPLAEMARDAKIAMQFHDAVAHAELFPLMRAANAVVLPSLREPFGIAAAEAMLLGAPVILSQTDGFVEIVGGEDCALMTTPGDANALAEAIWRVWRDPAAAALRAERARVRVEKHFSIHAAARAWVDLFAQFDHVNR